MNDRLLTEQTNNIKQNAGQCLRKDVINVLPIKIK